MHEQGRMSWMLLMQRSVRLPSVVREVVAMPENPNLYILDDGTLDTVVACDKCSWQGRYNPECPCSAGAECRVRDSRVRGDLALEMAREDHDCGAPPSDMTHDCRVNGCDCGYLAEADNAHHTPECEGRCTVDETCPNSRSGRS
jgi:hypothetical protein